MSLTMFSIGRDTQLVLIGPTGRIDLTHVTSFDSRQVTQSIRVDRLDGTHMGTELPKGWEGSFELERGSSTIDAAPISALSHVDHPRDEHEEQLASMPEQPHTSAAHSPSAFDPQGPQPYLDHFQPGSALPMIRRDRSLTEPRQVAGQNTATILKASQLTTPVAPLARYTGAASAIPAPGESPTSIAPFDLTPPPSIVANHDEPVQSLAPQAITQIVAAAAPATNNDGIGVAQESTRLQQILMHAVAPNHTPHARLPMLATQPVVHPERADQSTAEPLSVMPETIPPPELRQLRPIPAELPAELEPRQGTIILDGSQLGRWVIDHLERYASRPGATTTGVDPRMSAVYPGAPSGS